MFPELMTSCTCRANGFVTGTRETRTEKRIFQACRSPSNQQLGQEATGPGAPSADYRGRIAGSWLSEQHLDRVTENGDKCPQPFGCECPVDRTVIDGQGEFHDRADGQFAVSDYWFLAGGSDGEDRRLRRVDDR